MTRTDTFLATGYRHFVAVAETGSVRAASRQLNVAASAISRQISLLEKQLGMALFDRSGRQLDVTAAGQALLRGLRATTRDHEQTLDHISALKGLKRGHIRVATVESISTSILPEVLTAFSAIYPGLQVSVTVAGSDAVTALVRDHAADIGLTFNPTTLDGLDVYLTQDLPIGAVMSPKHPLAKSRKLTLAECLAYPVAWPSQGLSLRGILERKPSQRRQKPDPVFECNSLRVMAALAKRGSCIAFQTRIGIEQELAAKSLAFVPLSDKNLQIDRLTVVRRRRQVDLQAVDKLLAVLKPYLLRQSSVRK